MITATAQLKVKIGDEDVMPIDIVDWSMCCRILFVRVFINSQIHCRRKHNLSRLNRQLAISNRQSAISVGNWQSAMLLVASDAFRSESLFSIRKLNQSKAQPAPKTIALGSDRVAKIMAVRACLSRIAQIDSSWAKANVVARAVTTNIPAMPLTDWQLMQGARERALAVRDLLRQQRLDAEIYLGLEGGFHSISIEGEWHTFLRGWAYATDGAKGTFGAAPSITVPESLVKKVVEGRRELGLVIDEVSGRHDVRSRQGAWGVLSRDLVTRSNSFELALIAALAPFYNPQLYSS